MLRPKYEARLVSDRGGMIACGRGMMPSDRIPALISVSLQCRFFSMQDFADHIAEFWPAIRRAWDEHRDKHPILECDVAGRTVAAFPARQYIDSLSERTRDATRRQFARVERAGGTIIFVRDCRNQVLQSGVFTAREMEANMTVSYTHLRAHET